MIHCTSPVSCASLWQLIDNNWRNIWRRYISFHVMTGHQHETVWRIRWHVRIVVQCITVRKPSGSTSSMVIAINLTPQDRGHVMVILTWLSILTWDELIWYLQTRKWSVDWLMTVNSVLRSLHKFPIWWVIYFTNMENSQIKVSSTGNSFSNVLHLEAVAASHALSSSDPHTHVSSSIRWAWSITMAMRFSTYHWHMMMLPETEWIHMCQWRHTFWFMMPWRHGTLNYSSKIKSSGTLSAKRVSAVANMSHWRAPPRNMYFDIICNPSMLNHNRPFSVWFKWWFTDECMNTWLHVIGAVLTSIPHMLTMNMMHIWLNVQYSCIWWRGCWFPWPLLHMEVEPEDVPNQIRDVLGMLAQYGAPKDNSQKRPKRTLPWEQPSRRHLPDNDNEALPKMMNLLCQLVLRHDRDLNSLHQQNTFVLFLSTGPDSLMPQILQASAQWKQQKENNQVNQSLRQCLILTLVQTLVQRVNKVKESKKEDPLWTSSLQSKLILPDASWPFLKWDHSKKMLDLDGKASSIPMKEMTQHLEQLYKMLERSEAIIRFHALQNKSKQAPVIPWRLELDMKDHRLHALMASLVNSSVWQLIQVRLKPHHQQQSKMADELMRISKKK